MVLLLISIIGEAVANGVMDNIDHHKGSAALRDVWHLCKYIDRLFLILIGVSLTLITWQWLTIPIIIIMLVFAKLVWNHFYRSYVQFWQQADDTVKITTGWVWLDRQLGLHH